MACQLIGSKGNIPSSSESAVVSKSVHTAGVAASKSKESMSQSLDGRPPRPTKNSSAEPAAAPVVSSATRARGQKRKSETAPSRSTGDDEQPELVAGSKKAKTIKDVSTTLLLLYALTSVSRVPTLLVTHANALLHVKL